MSHAGVSLGHGHHCVHEHMKKGPGGEEGKCPPGIKFFWGGTLPPLPWPLDDNAQATCWPS